MSKNFRNNYLKVLNLEWSSADTRDRRAASLVCHHLKQINPNVQVKERSIHYGLFQLLFWSPDVLFITNPFGGQINLLTVQMAKLLGVTVVVGQSEGNYKDRKEFYDQFTWGVNKHKTSFEDLWCLWSDRVKNIVLNEYDRNQLPKRIIVTGAPGFDIYHYLKTKGNKTPQYDIVVMCWDFGPFVYPEDSRYSLVRRIYNSEEINRFCSDRDRFNDQLKKLIEDNQDLRVLIRLHPGLQGGYYAAGVDEIDSERVVFSKGSLIDDLMDSKCTLAYESTTILESWLLDKKTVLLNPSGPDFKRDGIWRGSHIAKSAVDVIDYIKAPSENETLISNRKTIIQEVIGFNDGENSKRIAKAILESERLTNRLNFYVLRYINWKLLFRRIIAEIATFIGLKKIDFNQTEVKAMETMINQLNEDW